MSNRAQHHTQHKNAPITKWAASTKNTWPSPARASSSSGSSLLSRNSACVAACSSTVFFGGNGMAATHRHFRPRVFLRTRALGEPPLDARFILDALASFRHRMGRIPAKRFLQGIPMLQQLAGGVAPSEFPQGIETALTIDRHVAIYRRLGNSGQTCCL